jgi:hypothetical protein
MISMVRKSAGKKMAEEAQDLKIDPATADLYVPRKSGDPTGQSEFINTVLTPGLSAETSGPEAEAVQQNVAAPMGRPIKLGAPTRFQSVDVAQGLATSGANVPAKPKLDVESYWMGLMEQFNDPIIAEYLTPDAYAAPRVEPIIEQKADTEIF